MKMVIHHKGVRRQGDVSCELPEPKGIPGFVSKCMELVPKDERACYEENALPTLIQTGALKTKEDWENYQKSLQLIPEDRRFYYTRNTLPEVINAGVLKTKKDWEDYNRSLEEVPSQRRIYYTLQALPAVMERGCSFDGIIAQLRIIQDYARRYGDLDFIWKTGLENLGRLHHIDSRGRPLKFDKTGGELNVFDGRLSGVLIRTITETAYRAWVKALEAGIPCEEILKYPDGHRKAGEYRVKPAGEGKVRVACLWVGQDVEEFMRNPENQTYMWGIHKQMEEIRRRLREEGIEHGHTHENNFTVKIVDGKPIVRIIDFDNAYVKSEQL